MISIPKSIEYLSTIGRYQYIVCNDIWNKVCNQNLDKKDCVKMNTCSYNIAKTRKQPPGTLFWQGCPFSLYKLFSKISTFFHHVTTDKFLWTCLRRPLHIHHVNMHPSDTATRLVISQHDKIMWCHIDNFLHR